MCYMTPSWAEGSFLVHWSFRPNVFHLNTNENQSTRVIMLGVLPSVWAEKAKVKANT